MKTWSGLIGIRPSVTGLYRVTVICHCCGFRNLLEELKSQATTITLICHRCEEQVVAEWPETRSI